MEDLQPLASIRLKSLKPWGKMSSSYTTKFTQFPSPLVCVIQTQLLLLPAAFMGGIFMHCVGNDPTQVEDRQDDLVL